MLKFDKPTKFALEMVISGGQIGADEAGLFAARQAGFKTGGTAPFGYRTCRGPNEELCTLYGLTQDSSYGYSPRTIKNVKNSDATLIIAKNLNSPGCVLTAKSAKRFLKPILQIKVPDRKPSDDEIESWVDQVTNFLIVNHVKILNVAGNRDHLPCNFPLFTTCQLILKPVFTAAYKDFTESLSKNE